MPAHKINNGEHCKQSGNTNWGLQAEEEEELYNAGRIDDIIRRPKLDEPFPSVKMLFVGIEHTHESIKKQLSYSPCKVLLGLPQNNATMDHFWGPRLPVDHFWGPCLPL